MNNQYKINLEAGTRNGDNPISPAYYQGNRFECIEVMAEITKNLQGMEAVDTGQVLKYIWRWKEKNGVEDLRKASYYLNDLIKRCEQ